MKATVERRQFRRAELEVPVTLQPTTEEGQEPSVAVTGSAKNVSLAGVYCHVATPCPLKTGQLVTCVVTVPPEQAKSFPFTRLLGKGWIVRIGPVTAGRRAGENPPAEQLLGVAIAFAPDVTALGTLEQQFY